MKKNHRYNNQRFSGSNTTFQNQYHNYQTKQKSIKGLNALKKSSTCLPKQLNQRRISQISLQICSLNRLVLLKHNQTELVVMNASFRSREHFTHYVSVYHVKPVNEKALHFMTTRHTTG